MKNKCYFVTMLLCSFLLAIPYATADNCVHYKTNDFLYLQVQNSTSSTPALSMNCNFTITNMSWDNPFGNITTTEVTGTGLYYWQINSSLPDNEYIATAYCKGSVVSSFQFCVVSDFLNNTLNALDSRMAANFTIIANKENSLDSSLNGNISTVTASENTINGNILAVGNNLTNVNMTLNNQLYNSTSFIISNTTTYFNSITATLSTISTDISNIPAAVWAYGTRTLTAFNFLVDLTTSAYDNIGLFVWNVSLRSSNTTNVTITSTTVTSTLLSVTDYTLNITNMTLNITNTTLNVTTGGITVNNGTTNQNVTLNVILPASATS